MRRYRTRPGTCTGRFSLRMLMLRCLYFLQSVQGGSEGPPARHTPRNIFVDLPAFFDTVERVLALLRSRGIANGTAAAFAVE